MKNKIPIIKSIFKFALPILLANLIQSGYQIIDAFWVGRIGPLAVAGVTNAGSILFLMMSIGIGFSIAGSVLTAQYFGAKNKEMINKTAAQTIFASIVVSILLSIITYFLVDPFFNIMKVPQDVLPYASSFTKVLLIGTVFSFIFMMFQSVMRAIGKMRTPIYIGIFTLILNFFLDPLFIYGYGFAPKMGVSGAAMATLITQIISAVIGMLILFNGKQGIKLSFKDFIPDLSFIKKTFFLGMPGSIEMGLRSISSVILMFLVNTFGAVAIAVYGVGGNVFMLTTMMPCMAFSLAVSILVGHKLGAREKKGAREIANIGTTFTFLIISFISIFTIIFAKSLLTFFIPNDQDVLELGVYYIRLVALAAPFLSLQFSASAILRASGNMISSMLVSLVSVWIFQIPFALIASKYLNYGVKGIFLSSLFSSFIVGIFIFFYIRKSKWENRELIHAGHTKKQEQEEELQKEIGEEMMIEATRPQ